MSKQTNPIIVARNFRRGESRRKLNVMVQLTDVVELLTQHRYKHNEVSMADMSTMFSHLRNVKISISMILKLIDAQGLGDKKDSALATKKKRIKKEMAKNP